MYIIGKVLVFIIITLGASAIWSLCVCGIRALNNSFVSEMSKFLLGLIKYSVAIAYIYIVLGLIGLEVLGLL